MGGKFINSFFLFVMYTLMLDGFDSKQNHNIFNKNKKYVFI
ncbi:hypothetical protein PHAMO_200009 [Magnetospirillum molischianum DSM 120]|uniref:Uncharacterized protein n=1 Tax=Magnetospirillum molischianum DSM 120 TaxID=1150626 RepID=H8FPY6_MAGML|nr:hypothetical protein PHAMO_200009 [Magnetospirillum molischianum DSM 120]